MNPENIESLETKYFYDQLIYGKEADLKTSKAMLKAFPFPVESDLSELDVLEVGLGRGEWAISLGSLSKTYTGVDYSKRTVEYVEDVLRKQCKGLKNKAVVSNENVLSMPFENESFDAAYCIGVLHHTKSPRKGFEELYRVLRKDGTINLMLYGCVFPRNLIRDTLFLFSRLGKKYEDLVIRFVMQAEKWGLPDNWFFRADEDEILHRDWYLAPIQFHHTVKEVTEWADALGGKVSYVFLDPYRDSLPRHKRWASSSFLGRFFCPDFMISIVKKVKE